MFSQFFNLLPFGGNRPLKRGWLLGNFLKH